MKAKSKESAKDDTLSGKELLALAIKRLDGRILFPKKVAASRKFMKEIHTGSSQ
jgi:hypothetical protein